jgi:hypothetical protein
MGARLREPIRCGARSPKVNAARSARNSAPAIHGHAQFFLTPLNECQLQKVRARGSGAVGPKKRLGSLSLAVALDTCWLVSPHRAGPAE